MQRPRLKSPADDVRTAGNTRQPEEQSSRRRSLVTRDWDGVVGALIAAAASLLIYSFQQVRYIDERLDRLEREASVLLDTSGVIKPSREALENKYHLEALQRRVDRLEERR